MKKWDQYFIEPDNFEIALMDREKKIEEINKRKEFMQEIYNEGDT